MEEEINSEQIKKELEECQKTKEEYLAGWKRERADFLNFKKDESERLKRIVDVLKEEIVRDLLPILDNVYRAKKELPENMKENSWSNGILNIGSQILGLFEKMGVKEINCENQKFDPNSHEAVENVEKEGLETGAIAEVLQKGYTLNNKVIRPSKVKVIK
jgi:molecular chaperone GrpE